MKIEELNKSQKDKNLLSELRSPKSIAECAVILGTSYNYASTKLSVFVAEGSVKKIKSFNNTTKYYLDQDKFELDYPKPTFVKKEEITLEESIPQEEKVMEMQNLN